MDMLIGSSRIVVLVVESCRKCVELGEVGNLAPQKGNMPVCFPGGKHMKTSC